MRAIHRTAAVVLASVLILVGACSDAHSPPPDETAVSEPATSSNIVVATDEIACTDAELVNPVEETASGDEQPSELVDGLQCLIAFADGVASSTYFKVGDGSSYWTMMIDAPSGPITSIEPTRDMVTLLFESIDAVMAPDIEQLLPSKLLDVDEDGHSYYAEYEQDGWRYAVTVRRNDANQASGFRIDGSTLDPKAVWQGHHVLPFSVEQVAFDSEGELSSTKMWCLLVDDPGNDTERCYGRPANWGYARTTIALEDDRVVALWVATKEESGHPGIDDVAKDAAELMEGSLADLVAAAGVEAANADDGKIVIVDDIPVWVSGHFGDGWRSFVVGTVGWAD